MKNLAIIFLFGLLISPAFAGKSGPDTLMVRTSAQCGDCKNRIEKALAFERGVKSSELDLETKIVTVIYKPGKTTPGKIREAISKSGYDADDVPADAKAYAKLPPCCKKPHDPDHKEHH